MSSAADLYLYEKSSNTTKDPNVFLSKKWVVINDNSNSQYRSGQSQIFTSSLANDSRWAAYSDAFLSIPLVFSLSGSGIGDTATQATNMDWSIGYKNAGWLQFVHSLQVSLGGSTLVQQTSYANLYNVFRLLTTLNYNDVTSIGSSIGFFPDTSTSFLYTTAATADGQGTCNNRNAFAATAVTNSFTSYESYNQGLTKRQSFINYDIAGKAGTNQSPLGQLLTEQACNNIYKSYVFKKAAGVQQVVVMGIIRLKDLHSLFQNFPLSKGVNMTITMNLNQTQFTLTTGPNKELTLSSISSQQNGTNPMMIASAAASNGSNGCIAGTKTINASCFVGSQIQWSQQVTDGCVAAPFASQISLNVPCYVMDSVIESAYLSSPNKRIFYTDIAQYLISNISPNAQFNSLITNGQAGLKSVVCMPFFNTSSAGVGANASPLLSPFDTAGGTTSPLCLLNNFNVRISGENMLQDNALYTYQTFMEHLYGCNAYSAGVDGMGGNGLIGQLDFESSYCYHYVNCSRMEASQLSVPKSVQIVGTNQSAKNIDLICFTEFGCVIDLNVLTGARVA